MLCSESDIFVLLFMQATPFQDDIYLGYSSHQPLVNPTIQSSFIGGQPLFLTPPKPHHLLCQDCHEQQLVFIGQLFCPLDLPHAYNRVFYLLHCPKCLSVQCFKQQAPQQGMAEASTVIAMKSILPQRMQIDSQPLAIKDLKRIVRKAQAQVREETILEQEDDDEDEGEEIDLSQEEKEMMLQMRNCEVKMELSKQQLEQMRIQAEQAPVQAKKDHIFEEYRRVMQEIDSPILLYSNIPLPYNSQPLNPRHNCRHCHAPLSLELQLTEQLLLVSPTLVGMEWGSIMVYSCSHSCSQSMRENVVTQWEMDAIKDKEVSMLKKKQKQKKRKQKQKEKKEEAFKQSAGEEENKVQESDEEGDWD